jgi:membrane peptidoglycan carboxypeptidase
MSREHRLITRYADIPPVVRDAILSVEDKRFFSHNGIDYLSVPRVLRRIRGAALQGLGRLIARKAEEMRLSVWIEEEMTRRFGSKRRQARVDRVHNSTDAVGLSL